MKRAACLFAAMLSAGVLAGTARPARACGKGGGLDGLVALAAVGTLAAVTAADVGFTVTDLVTAGKGMPRGYGIAETAVALPEALLFGASLWQSYNQTGTFSDAKPTLMILSAWTGALAVHGLYTAINPRAPSRRLEQDEGDVDHRRGPRAPNDPDHPHAAASPRLRLDLAPTVFASQDRALLPGAVLLGRF
jgi:hypothetical protein